MSLELTIESLRKCCRLCLSPDGEVNIFENRVKLPSENIKDDNNSEGDADEDIFVVSDMLGIFQKHDEDSFTMLDENFKLICSTCLNDVVKAFMLHKRILNTSLQLKLLYDEVKKIEELNSPAMEVEHLEDDLNANDEDTEEHQEESNEVAIEGYDADDANSNQECIEYVEALEENSSCHVKEDLEYTIDYSIDDEETNESVHITFSSNQLNSKESEQGATQQQPNPSENQKDNIVEEDETSFLITKFIPTKFQLQSLDNDEVVENSLKHLHSLDYTAIKVKASDINSIAEKPLVMQSIEEGTEDMSAHSDKPSATSIFVCKYCPEAFSGMNFLLTHTKRAHVCKYCTKAFPKTTDLHVHIRKEHHGNHTCAVCQKSLTTHSNLREHLARLHGIRLPTEVTLMDYIASQYSDNESTK